MAIYGLDEGKNKNEVVSNKRNTIQNDCITDMMNIIMETFYLSAGGELTVDEVVARTAEVTKLCEEMKNLVD